MYINKIPDNCSVADMDDWFLNTVGNHHKLFTIALTTNRSV